MRAAVTEGDEDDPEDPCIEAFFKENADSSFYLFKRENYIRMFCSKLVSTTIFQCFVFTAIMITVVSAISENANTIFTGMNNEY